MTKIFVGDLFWSILALRFTFFPLLHHYPEVKNSSYPRLDPTIIASVLSPDRSKLLLARGLRFPTLNMWSCLAGFMEPGN